jgi:hypothetical protein
MHRVGEHELVVVAEPAHGEEPGVEHHPVVRLDDVLDQDDLVAVDLREAGDVPRGGA